jgi:hypothetical protein
MDIKSSWIWKTSIYDEFCYLFSIYEIPNTKVVIVEIPFRGVYVVL